MLKKGTPMEKLAFMLVTTTHKLKPYFQAHIVVVLTTNLYEGQ